MGDNASPILPYSHTPTQCFLPPIRPVAVSPRLRVTVVILSLLVFLASAVSAQTVVKELAGGVTLRQNISSSPDSPQIVNILTIDPKAPGIRIRAVLAQDRVYGTDWAKGRETVSSIAKRLNATAAMNADYFPMSSNCPGDALNLHISGGELMSEPMPNRVVFGITSDGKMLFDKLELDARIILPDKWFPIRGINRPRRMHELVAYTSKFFTSTCTSSGGSEAVITTQDLPVKVGVPIKGTVSEIRSSCGNTPIPDGAIVLSGAGTGAKFVDEYLKPGTNVTIEFNLKPSKTTGWEKVVEAVGGGPWLVKDGKVSIDAAAEGFQPILYLAAHPRTALGVTGGGKLVLVTVDGRQNISSGMTLIQLAQLMLSQECVEAINLDGGGSTTMAASFGILNSPCEGAERPVANALAVFADTPSTPPVEFSIKPPDGPAPSGTAAQLSLVDTSGQPITPELAAQAIWAAAGGAGFVDQSGRFYGFKVRKGSVTAKIGSCIVSVPVETVPGAACKLTAGWETDPSGAPNRSILVVSAADVNGNAVGDQRLSVEAIGGTPDQAELTTAGDGRASTGITWDAAPAVTAQATVKLGDLPPVILPR